MDIEDIVESTDHEVNMNDVEDIDESTKKKDGDSDKITTTAAADDSCSSQQQQQEQLQQLQKRRLADFNAYLLCSLCCGYMIDATTIIECLHSCRLCGCNK